jgi:UDP-N-acetylglucosamine 2-epimerase
MTGKKNPFGDGKAAARIVSCLLEAAKEDPE